MFMYSEIIFGDHKNKNVCRDNAKRVAQFVHNFKPGQGSFLGPGDEEKWYGNLIDKTSWRMEVDSGECDARIRQERAPCVQVLISIVEKSAST